MAISYVDPVAGDNGNGGTGTGDAWATLQHALDNVTAGNDIYLMATGTESPGVVIDVDTNASTITTPINVYGADGSGNRLDGSGYYTIDMGGTYRVDFTTVASYHTWHDVRITNGSNQVFINAANSFITFNRCSIDSSAATGGMRHSQATTLVSLIDCDVYGNAGRGLHTNGAAAGRGNYHVYGSRIHDNGGAGIEGEGDFTGFMIVQDCEIYDNAGPGIDALSGAYLSIAGNTFYGNGASGNGSQVYLDTCHAWITDNTIVGSTGGGFGINFQTNPAVYIANNHYHDNSSGQWGGVVAGSSDEDGLQTGDPLFMDVTDGVENFTPQPGSPLIDNALAGNDIGAVQSTAAGPKQWY